MYIASVSRLTYSLARYNSLSPHSLPRPFLLTFISLFRLEPLILYPLGPCPPRCFAYLFGRGFAIRNNSSNSKDSAFETLAILAGLLYIHVPIISWRLIFHSGPVKFFATFLLQHSGARPFNSWSDRFRASSSKIRGIPCPSSIPSKTFQSFAVSVVEGAG